MKAYSVAIKTILSEPDEKEWESLCKGLPDQLIEKSYRFKSWREKAMRLYGWQMLLKELDKINEPKLIHAVKFEEKGKPFFENTNIFFNISNSKNTVIVVIAPYRVGVDFEFLRTDKKMIYPRVFCREEIEFLERSKNERTDFIKLWTRKEAVVKLFGGGISMGLANFSVLKNELFVFEEVVIIEEIDLQEGFAHVAFFKVEL